MFKRPIGIGETFEFDVEVLADDAARAFAADDVGAADGLVSPAGLVTAR